MQRYRIVIVMALFGLAPVAATLYFALTFFVQEQPAPPVAATQASAPAEAAPPPPPPPPPKQKVWAAARALPVGALLGGEDLAELEIEPGDYREDRHFPFGDEALAPHGYAVRAPLAAGAPLDRASVVGPGQRGFLAAALAPGKRAVTVEVGAATAHAALIDPGDRVDVILTAALGAAASEFAGDFAQGGALARTIVEDVRVVAVDRRTAPPDDRNGEQAALVTATLEVWPEQGDRLVLGEREGQISLAVRPLAAAAAAAPRHPVTLVNLLLPPPAEAPPVEAPSLVETWAAARPLEAGMLIGEDDVAQIRIDPALFREDRHFAGGVGGEAPHGYAVRAALPTGALLDRAAAVAPGRRGFLATVLAPDMRAVTVAVGPATGHAALVAPGDRVDVILIATLPAADGAAGAGGPEGGALARAIVEDVRVVAVDRRTAEAPREGGDNGAGGAPAAMVTATLEVSPEQGDRLALASHEGQISLAVRPLTAAASGPRRAVALGNLLLPRRPEAPPPAAPPPTDVRVFRGSEAPDTLQFEEEAE